MRIQHENGYSAEIYGESSLIVIRPDGTKMLHTGFRNADYEDEVLRALEDAPELDMMLKGQLEDNDKEGNNE